MELLTKTVCLPVSGKEATVRQATAKADNLLWANRMRLAEVLPQYWAACTVQLGEVTDPALMENAILGLYVPDQEFLAIEIYRCTYNDKLVLSSTCSRCGESTRHELGFAAMEENQIPVPPGLTGPPDPTWEFTLPQTLRHVVFGYRTGKQERDLLARGKADIIVPVFEAIRSVDGKRPRLTDFEQWPSPDVRALRDEIASKRCGYDPTVRFTHRGCGSSEVVNLFTDPSFLLAGVVA